MSSALLIPSSLACQKGVKVPELLRYAKIPHSFINQFHNQTTATAALAAGHRTNKQHKLIQDAHTRWNCTYHMLPLKRYV